MQGGAPCAERGVLRVRRSAARARQRRRWAFFSSLIERISAYLRGEQGLAGLVSWVEDAMREGEFGQGDFAEIREVVGHLGLSDVAAFGLTWENAVGMLSRLGYRAKVDIQAVRN